MWHEYTRSNRPKHWDDHRSGDGLSSRWFERDAHSRQRARSLLLGVDLDPYGLGTVRSLSEYEAYAGIDFTHCRVQDHTRRHSEPPNPPAEEGWALRANEHVIQMDLPAAAIPPGVRDDSHFWYVGIFDSNGDELLRQDVDLDELKILFAGESDIVSVIRGFESTAEPSGWEIRPCLADGRWIDPWAGKLVRSGLGCWRNILIGDSEAQFTTQTQRETRLLVAPSLPGCVTSTDVPRVVGELAWRTAEGGYVASASEVGRPFLANNTGALILELADGCRSVSDIAASVQKLYGLIDPPHGEVESLLENALSFGIVEMV